MFNINEFTTRTPVLALQRAMQEIRNTIEASFEDQLFIALLAAVQGKGSDDSIVYLSELIGVNSHTKRCLVDASLQESLAQKGFLSAIRRNRAFWCDVLQGNILKFELEDRINDLKAKLGMYNKSLYDLCMLRLEQEKQANAEKLAEAHRMAEAKATRRAKRVADKQLIEAKLAEQEYQADLAMQAKQARLVEEQVQAKLALVEAYATEDAVRRALDYQAAEHAKQLADQAAEHAKQLADQATADGILSLIDQLEDTQRLELLATLAAKYAPSPSPTPSPTKRGKGNNQATLPV